MNSEPRPHVYQAVNQIIRAFSKSGIGKRHTNAIEQYHYRSIDDVLNRLGPLLARHGLCILPRALLRESEDRTGDAGALLVSVRLLVAFDLVSARDGSKHIIKAWGEALDQGDKGTAKAMSAAFKGAMLQLFCIPVGSAEADVSSFRLRAHHTREPVEGWSCWTDGICDMIGVCETGEALDRVRSRQASLLGGLSREKPDLYAKIGDQFSARLNMIGARTGPITPLSARSRRVAKTAPLAKPTEPLPAAAELEDSNV